MLIFADPTLVATLSGAYALLFAVAGAHKLYQPARFRAALAAYRIVPVPMQAILARLLPWLEMVTAIGLLSGLIPASVTASVFSCAHAVAALVAAALLAIYGLAMAVSLARGESIDDCGCQLGREAHPVQWALVWRNLSLALLAAFLCAMITVEPTRALSAFDYLTVLLATMMAGLLYAVANMLVANHARQRDLIHD